MNFSVLFFFILFLVLILLILWMRWRQKASKGRFALATISALITCLTLGITAASTPLPIILLSYLTQRLGIGQIENNAPNYIAVFITIFISTLIYRFGTKAIRNWESPTRLSEHKLSEQNQENDLPALAIEQARLLLKRQPDPIASEAVSNWKNRVAPLPKAIESKDLLRELLTSAIREITIEDDNWRDEYKMWVGEIPQVFPEKTGKLIALVFDSTPSREKIEERLTQTNIIETDEWDRLKIYALYTSYCDDEREQKSIIAHGKSVELMSSRSMILMSLDLKSYARDILKTFSTTTIGGTNATLKSSYVELQVVKSDKDPHPTALTDTIDEWLIRNDNSHLAITGEFGQGKSTALLHYCCRWAELYLKHQTNNDRIPLLIELRGKNPAETDPLSFLSAWCSRYSLAPIPVYNLIKSGEALVIFEGFDELKNAGRMYHRHQHFNALWRFAYPGTKLIFTGRPNFFLDQAEANRTLRHEKSRLVSGEVFTEVWQLQKMKIEQIKLACRSYDSITKQGIIDSAKENNHFFEIVSRPSMLPVVATIWDDISQLKAKGIPLTSAVLVEHYIQAIFSRKEVELEKDRIVFDSPQGSRYLALPKQVRELLTMCIAWRMVGSGQKNTISRPEITEMVKEVYVILFSIGKAEHSLPEITEGLVDFEKRFEDDSFLDRVDIITTELCSAGIMIPDPTSGASNLRFPHKQFFEFLIAKCAYILCLKNTFNTSRIIKHSSSEKRIFRQLWSERNSIEYFAEKCGTDLTTPFSRTELYLFRGLFLNAFAVERVRTLEKRTISLTNNASSKASDKLTILTSLSLLSNASARAISLIDNIFSKTRENPYLLYGCIAIFLVFSIFFSFPLFLALTSFAFIQIGLIYVLNQVSEKEKLWVLNGILKYHWKAGDQYPESTILRLKTAIRSLAKGKVTYPDKQIEHRSVQTEFLYPSNYFDKL